MAAQMRGCAACTVVDDHPRHTYGSLNAAGKSVRVPEPWHLDCHANAGCESCAQRIADAGGKTGPALVKHIKAELAARAKETSS